MDSPQKRNWDALRGKQTLDPMDVYEKLRIAHQEIKDCVFAENFEEMSEEMKNAIEGVHAVLYMAEAIVCKEAF